MLAALAMAIALPAVGAAQIPSLAEGQTFEKSPGQWHRVVTNLHESHIVAYYASYRCGGRLGGLVIDDSLLYASVRPIAPDESAEIRAEDPSKCEGGVKAPIFADGHVEGDAHLLDDLYLKRQGAYEALNESMRMLGAARDERSVDTVIRILDERRRPRTYPDGRGIGAATVYGWVVRTVRDNEHIRFPTDPARGGTYPREDPTTMSMEAIKLARAAALMKRLDECHFFSRSGAPRYNSVVPMAPFPERFPYPGARKTQFATDG
jgi:hypothetical protein